MPETAALPVAPSTPAASTMYDPDTDPRVQESNARAEREFAALTASKGQAPVVAAPPAAPIAPPAPKLPKVLAMRAKLAGFAETDLEGLTEPEIRELLDDVAIAKGGERRIGTVDHASGSAAAGFGVQGLEPDAGTGPALPAAPAAAPTPPVDPRVELKKLLLATVDEDVANGIVAYVDGIFNLLTPRLGEIEQHIKEAVPYVRKLAANETDNLIDQGFADLGAAFERVFGKGGASSIDRKSPQYRRRCQVVKILRGMPVNPQSPLDIRKTVASLGRSEFGDLADPNLAAGDDDDDDTPAAPPPRRHNVRGANGKFSEADYQEAALQVPSGRTTSPKANGREKAIETVTELQSKYDADGGDEINRGDDSFLPARR
jgi:hypothetical protein